MNKYRIHAPVAAYNGETVGVRFVDGVAVIQVDPDNPNDSARTKLNYFNRHGYGVADITKDDEAKASDTGTPGGPGANAALESDAARLNRRDGQENGDPRVDPDGSLKPEDPADGPLVNRAETDTDTDGPLVNRAETDTDPFAPATLVDPSVKRPAGNASVGEWRKWAVEHGRMSEAEASELSRDEIKARYVTGEEGNH
jgi:hypothetical protein